MEDQKLFRKGIRAMLEREPDIEVMSEHEDGASFMKWLSEQEDLPDVVLLDMNLPSLNGMEVTELLQNSYPAIKIIILTVYNQYRFISKMVALGVAGYLEKNSDIEEVVLSIRTVNKTNFYFNESTVRAMREGYRHKSKNSSIRTINNMPVDISEREVEILKLICMEYTTTEIAEKLYISPRTVDGHRNNLLAKTDSRNTAGLVVFAIANDLYEIGFPKKTPGI